MSHIPLHPEGCILQPSSPDSPEPSRETRGAVAGEQDTLPVRPQDAIAAVVATALSVYGRERARPIAGAAEPSTALADSLALTPPLSDLDGTPEPLEHPEEKERRDGSTTPPIPSTDTRTDHESSELMAHDNQSAVLHSDTAQPDETVADRRDNPVPKPPTHTSAQPIPRSPEASYSTRPTSSPAQPERMGVSAGDKEPDEPGRESEKHEGEGNGEIGRVVDRQGAPGSVEHDETFTRRFQGKIELGGQEDLETILGKPPDAKGFMEMVENVLRRKGVAKQDSAGTVYLQDHFVASSNTHGIVGFGIDNKSANSTPHTASLAKPEKGFEVLRVNVYGATADSHDGHKGYYDIY